MSTPIEIVREMQLWRRGEGRFADDRERGAFKAIELMPYTPQQFGEALDTVLRDAERFAALGAAHLNPPFKGSIAVKVFDPESFSYVLYKGELSELADRLREENK